MACLRTCATAARASIAMSSICKVLFCGEELPFSYTYTSEALQNDHGIKVVRCAQSEIKRHLQEADVAVPLMCKLDAQLLRTAKRLKMIIQYGVGVEGIDIPEATEQGIWVSNIPSSATGNALSCAEHAIYLMMATLRQQNAMRESIQQGRVGVPVGETLFGKSVLIVGFGNIAKELKPFHVKLMGVRRSPWGTNPSDSHLEAELQQRGVFQDLPGLVGQADLIVLTCSLTDATRGMVDRTFLKACKPGVRIINVARGGLLDYNAVNGMLDTDAIGALGLDVQWQEPWDPQHYITNHPKVVMTPHVAGVTELSYRTMAQVVANEVRRHVQGLPPAIQLNSIRQSMPDAL
ncbi:MAG: D-3-phosphoglycerate dehydrogenase [Trebouxia sp. A1-2]|nr:MAG: D-3-phosphoglycerate dehydrogenase [Trebouxia sp. A1-2]